jgi:hypothetical protein
MRKTIPSFGLALEMEKAYWKATFHNALDKSDERKWSWQKLKENKRKRKTEAI